MSQLRVFLSYSRLDYEKILRITHILSEIGFLPAWDNEIVAGSEFSDYIRNQIAKSHVFMPVLTPNSIDKPWLNQELGYALGIGVPILPVSIGALPQAMIAGIHSIRVDDELSQLREGICRANPESLLLSSSIEGEMERLGINTYVAEHGEERTRLLVKSARELSQHGIIRQRALFSSFSIPKANVYTPIWNDVEASKKRSEYFRKLLRQERITLEEHAVNAGCKLILAPITDPTSADAQAHMSQLKILAEFLSSMPDDKVEVSFVNGKYNDNLTILGDWFAVKSVTPRPGEDYKQTLFCHHAPTVFKWIDLFDKELQDLLNDCGIENLDSRRYALNRIEEWIAAMS